MVVEDEYFLADDIRCALLRHDAQVLGPAGGVEEARRLLAGSAAPDCAVLDINLRGDLIFSFAAELAAEGVPFVFTTGYDRAMLPERFADVPRWEKPFEVDELVDSLRRLLTRNAAPV